MYDRVFVRGRIPSPIPEASTRPMNEYPLQYMGQVFVPGTWGKYLPVDEQYLFDEWIR